MVFGTNINPAKSKTKCIVFSKKKAPSDPAPIKLDGKNLPWVQKISHLGISLESDNSMRADMTQKRGQFIAKANSLLQEFHFSSKDILLKVVDTYASCCYGSSLWNLMSKESEKLFNSWNVTVRNILKVDKKTHRFLIEPLSGHLHLKTMLMARLVNFYKSLLNSPKFTFRFLACIAEKDFRTTLGQTLEYLRIECELSNIEELSSGIVKKYLRYKQVPHESNWQVSLAKELLQARDGNLIIEGFNKEEIDELVSFACTQ